MRRGEIWDTDYPLTQRHNAEPYGHGPVVAVLTSSIRLQAAPGNVLLLADEHNGLAQDSVLNVSQVMVVDKRRLERRRGQLDGLSLDLLEMGLKLVFALR